MKRYFDDEKDNVAFERCIDVMTNMLIKYGPKILARQKEERVKAILHELLSISENNRLRRCYEIQISKKARSKDAKSSAIA